MPAWVKGAAADMDTALSAAVELLGAARTPVIAGLNADVSAIRAAYDLAGRVGASVDTLGAAGTYAELGALSRVGAMTSTPAEVVGRADAVLVVGSAPWNAALSARILDARPSRGRAAGSDRALLALGGSAPQGGTTIPAENGILPALALLRAHLRGHLADDSPIAGAAERLSGSLYVAVLYDPAEIGEFGVETVQGLVVDLNDRTRAFALPVQGGNQDRAVVPVAAWTTGQAPRVGFGRRVPEHDPWRFDAARQVAAGEADAALWIASVPAPAPDWLGRVPSIALMGDAAADAAEVVIGVGVPGRDHGGVLWNDTRAALTYWPAQGAGAPADLPSAAAVIGQLAQRLAGRSETAC
ncbi:formyltransferase [Methylobacterium aerolatum]|uniref:Formylmethanofuran dehydrogenase subunit B n=1 Tax=Methylobacterium aerolatum TaxID=418708 RepID=A0ABU0HV89_9HYPH|nr:formyltransferase [Methylobacterium aerolatum]MDQ0445812.1 formylmethanofuran dehydrogenase subunit B [Methylobacterium aerolatum]GJD35927.1 Formyltransferase/hydrolase complex Fhc subunit B [Methylobacterium aerolatum]